MIKTHNQHFSTRLSQKKKKKTFSTRGLPKKNSLGLNQLGLRSIGGIIVKQVKNVK